MDDKYGLDPSVLKPGMRVEPETKDKYGLDPSILKPDIKAPVEDAVRINPDDYAKQLRMSKESGYPTDLIAKEPKAVENRLRTKSLREQLESTTVAKEWFSNKDNARVSHDDAENLGYMENLALGLGERTGTTVGSILTFTNTLADSIEENIGLGGFEVTRDGIRYIRSSELLQRDTSIDALAGGLNELDLGFDEDMTTSWEDVKENPRLSTVVPFIIEQGILSVPDMALALASMPALTASMTGRIASDRAANDSREEPTLNDLIKAAPASIASALLERFGARGMLGLDDAIKEIGLRPLGKAIGKASAKEAGTEGLQEGFESVGGSLGTKRGFRAGETLDQMLAGAVAGGGIGGTVRTVTGTIENANMALRNAEALKDINNVMSKLRERSPEKYAEFKGKVLRQSGVKKVSISGEGVTQYNQSGGDMSWIEDLGLSEEGKLDFYRAMEGDIELTPEQYSLLPKDVVDALAEHTRLDDGMTEAEAKEFQESGLQEEFDRNIERLEDSNPQLKEDAQVIQQKIEEQLQAVGESPYTSGYFGILMAQRYITRSERTGKSALELFARDNLQFRNEVEQGKLVDELNITLDKARSGKSAEEFLGLSKRPIIDDIIKRGGIEPGSFLASELAARGVTTSNARGLFRKGGLVNGDNIVASEVPFFAEQSFNDDYNGYVPVDTLIDAIEREAALGEPNRTAEEVGNIERFNADLQNLEARLEEIGMSLTNTDEEIIEVFRGREFDQTDIESDNFKEWFGDSKVVDDNGKPLVVYHGTGTKIEEFSFDFTGQGNDQVGSGFYFTTSEDQAKGYSTRTIDDKPKLGGQDSPNVVEVYLSIQNPLDSNEVGSVSEDQVREILKYAPQDHLEDALWDWGDLSSESKETVLESAIPSYVIDEDNIVRGLFSLANDMFGNSAEGVRLFNTAVKEVLGYDGVRAYYPDADNIVHYVAFFPEQIKSVNNRGTFDPNDSRILYQSDPFEQIRQMRINSVSSSLQEAYGSERAKDLFDRGIKGELTGVERRSMPDRILRSLDSLRNSYNQENRASIQFTPSGTIFNLGPNADRSSFLHESGHLFLEQLRQDQQEFGVNNPQLVDDWNTVNEWWAKNASNLKKEAIEYANKAKDSEAVEALAAMSDENVKSFVRTGDLTRSLDANGYLAVAMHEQWARGVEDYFRTGKAPSVALEGPFNRFRAWVGSIYRAMKRRLGRDVLDVQFSPEVRDVMDRLLATDEEIELVSSQYDMQAMFKSAEEIGMTPKQFEEYQRDIQRSIEEAKSRQLKKHLNEVERERMKWWIEERSSIRDKVLEELNSSPEYRLIYNLINGTEPNGEPVSMRFNRMDRAAINEILENEGSAKRLPKVGNKVLYATSKNEGSTHPDIIAQSYGFNNSKEMLIALMNTRPMEEVANERADARMKEEHGDMEVPDQAIEEAVKSVHGDKRGDILVQELNALRQGQQQMKSAFVRSWAKQQIGKRKVDNIQPSKFLSAEKRYARKAAKAFKSGDMLEAQRAKFRQMMNHFMAKESYKVKAEVDKSKRYMQKFNAKKKKFKNIDADYLDRIREILGSYQLGPRMSDKKRLKIELAAINEWIQRQQEDEGAIFNIPQEILDVDDKTHYRDLSLDEYRTLVDSIRNIETQGVLKKKALINGELRDINQMQADILNRLDILPTKKVEEAKKMRQDANFKDKFIERLHSFDASLRKVEFLLEFMDGEKLGPAHQAFFQPIADAEAKKNDIVKSINEVFMEKLESLPKDVRKKLGRSEFVPSLGREMNRGNLLMLALNIGNDSNLDKLVRGAKQEGADWNEQGIMEALDVLTKEEWDFVQSVWDAFDGIYPQVQEIYRRENGVSPEKIEPRKIQTKHGEYTGRYFPMMYDPRRSAMARDLEGKTALEAMQSQAVKASVFSGMTKARTSFAAPVLLDINALPQQVVKMAHYVTHYEPVRVLRKLLAKKNLANAITEKLGEAYYRELKTWVGDIASDGRSDKNMTVWDRAIDAMRTNVTIAIMGLSYTTGTAQLLGYSQSIDALSKQVDGSYNPKNASLEIASAAKQFMTQKGAVEKIMNESGEMRHRIDNIDRDISHAMKKLSGKKGAWKQFQRSTLMHIAYVQFYMVDVPTWLAAKNKATKEGMSSTDAIKYADNIVRATQTAGGLKDLSSFQRARGWQNAFSMFYSFFNLLYNVITRAVGDTNFKKSKDVSRLAARAAVVLVLPTALEAMMRGEGPDKDEEESYAKWLALKSTFYAATSVPLLRDLVGVAEGYRYSSTPINSIGESIERTLNKVSRDIDEGELNADTVKQIGVMFGYLFGAPVLQPQRTIDAFEKWSDDGTMPDLVEFMRGPDKDE